MREPIAISEVAAAIQAGNIRVCYSKCWTCISGFHHDPPEPHPWAGDEDIEHAKAIGQAAAAEGNCGCPCAHGEHVPNADAGMVQNEEWDVDEDGTVLGSPCEQCGEVGACAYDQEGRPMIHAAIEDGAPEMSNE